MRKSILYVLLIFCIISLTLSACDSSYFFYSDLDNPSEDAYQNDTPNTENNNEEATNEKDSEEQSAEDNSIPLYDVLIRNDVSTLAILSEKDNKNSKLGVMDKLDCLPLLGLEENYYVSCYRGQKAYLDISSCSLINFDKSENENVEKIISVAKELLGYPYVWGSIRYLNEKGNLNKNFIYGEFDCSALTQYAYYIGAGIKLNLTTRTQVSQGREVAFGKINRGDLLFFTNAARIYNTGLERIGHVAIYLGNNYIIHTASDYAVIEPMSITRISYFITARRFFD